MRRTGNRGSDITSDRPWVDRVRRFLSKAHPNGNGAIGASRAQTTLPSGNLFSTIYAGSRLRPPRIDKG